MILNLGFVLPSRPNWKCQYKIELGSHFWKYESHHVSVNKKIYKYVYGDTKVISAKMIYQLIRPTFFHHYQDSLTPNSSGVFSFHGKFFLQKEVNCGLSFREWRSKFVLVPLLNFEEQDVRYLFFKKEKN